MNKKAYEAPDMLLRMLMTDNVASESGDDNLTSDDAYGEPEI